MIALFASPWKIATGAAALIALVLTALLMSSYFETRDLMSQREKLAVSINDPKVGYIAQLAQARTNVETLKFEIERQNAAYDVLSKDSQARLAATKAALATAIAKRVVLEKQLDGFLTTKPQGATLEDRVRDIDNRAMSEFVQ